jgi:hypothetical protein
VDFGTRFLADALAESFELFFKPADYAVVRIPMEARPGSAQSVIPARLIAGARGISESGTLRAATTREVDRMIARLS